MTSEPENTPTNLLGFFEAVEQIRLALDKAGQHIYIKTQTLNHPIFGDDDFIETLKSKLISSRRFQCHILVEEVKPSKRNADFIRLYKRLTDYVEIRLFVPPEIDADRRQYIIVDHDLLAWQSYRGRHDMRIFTEKHTLHDFTASFENAWNASDRDMSLLNLYM